MSGQKVSSSLCHLIANTCLHGIFMLINKAQSECVKLTFLAPVKLCTVLGLSTSTLWDTASCSWINVKQYGVTKAWRSLWCLLLLMVLKHVMYHSIRSFRLPLCTSVFFKWEKKHSTLLFVHVPKLSCVDFIPSTHSSLIGCQCWS